ncbi:MAG: hypothetical protein JWP40_4487 [Blastococcus sp.]|nr:hypothetical protein [Blastococcus sp.]
MSEVDPDPRRPADAQREPVLGDREMPGGGDPTQGGKHGEVGSAPSITSDEPDDGRGYPAGGGSVAEDTDAVPVAEPGRDA